MQAKLGLIMNEKINHPTGKAGCGVWALHRTLPRRWADHLSHPSGPKPWPAPTLTHIRDQPASPTTPPHNWNRVCVAGFPSLDGKMFSVAGYRCSCSQALYQPFKKWIYASLDLHFNKASFWYSHFWTVSALGVSKLQHICILQSQKILHMWKEWH